MDKIVAITKAVADESRVRILMCLDGTPLCLCQITEVLGLAASTVSKHLQILVHAGLVKTWSQGRWHYYALNSEEDQPLAGRLLDLLREHLADAAVVADDHAKRALVMKDAPASCSEAARPRVLFLCSGNSCRSQMAEALLRRYAGKRFEVYSAGLAPRAIHPMTYEVMAEIGVELRGQGPKDVLKYLNRMHFGYLITVCSRAEARYPVFPGVSYRLHWPFEDPAQVEGPTRQRLVAFRRVRSQIEKQILSWLKELAAQGRLPAVQERASTDERTENQCVASSETPIEGDRR